MFQAIKNLFQRLNTNFERANPRQLLANVFSRNENENSESAFENIKSKIDKKIPKQRRLLSKVDLLLSEASSVESRIESQAGFLKSFEEKNKLKSKEEDHSVTNTNQEELKDIAQREGDLIQTIKQIEVLIAKASEKLALLSKSQAKLEIKMLPFVGDDRLQIRRDEIKEIDTEKQQKIDRLLEISHSALKKVAGYVGEISESAEIANNYLVQRMKEISGMARSDSESQTRSISISDELAVLLNVSTLKASDELSVFRVLVDDAAKGDIDIDEVISLSPNSDLIGTHEREELNDLLERAFRIQKINKESRVNDISKEENTSGHSSFYFDVEKDKRMESVVAYKIDYLSGKLVIGPAFNYELPGINTAELHDHRPLDERLLELRRKGEGKAATEWYKAHDPTRLTRLSLTEKNEEQLRHSISSSSDVSSRTGKPRRN